MTNKETADLFCKEWRDGKSKFVIKTSGSTGTPKTVELGRGQMIASAEKTIEALDLREDMTSLVCLDVNFVAGMMMLVRSMTAKMDMIVVEPTANPLEGITQRIDFAAMVPYQVTNTQDVNFPGKVIVGGAPISSELLRRIQGITNAAFYATFGMTETISHIALQKLNGNNRQEFFEALNGVALRLDKRGCLVISADYLDDEVVTNDIVELIDTRRFRWLGRYDNVINSGGVKVMPEKIEKLIEDRKLSNRHFVTGIEHPQLGQQVVLVIEGMLSQEAESELIDYLKKSLGRYEVPKHVLYAETFTTTPTQKINRIDSLKNALPRPSSLQRTET